MTEIIGYIAAVLSAVASLPQLIKVLKTKSAEDVSMVMLIAFFSGNVLWVTYGALLQAPPVWIANIIMGSILLSIILLKVKYAKT